MNGATEATLAELLRVAEQQNKNLNELVKAFKATGGKTSGTASADANKKTEESANKSSMAMGALGAAVNLVTGIFSTMFEIVGKVVGGLTKVASNLIDLGIQAATTGARLSDLYAAFKDLPFFLGDLMGVFAKIIKFSETLLDSYREITKSGASFSGNLFEMLQAATNGYMTLQEFTNVVKSNSDIFATMGGNVQAGINKFSEYSKNLLGPDSKFGGQMMALGYTIEESAGAIADFIRGQGTMNKRGLENVNEVSASVMEYREQLDSLSKITGIQRDEIEKAVKEKQMEASWQNLVAGLTKDQAAFAQEASAAAYAKGGKVLQDQVRQGIQGLFATINKDQDALAAMSQGGSIRTSQLAYNLMYNSAKDNTTKMKELNAYIDQLAVNTNNNANAVGKATNAWGAATGNPLFTATNALRLHALKIQNGTNMEEAANAQRQKQYDGNAKRMAESELGMRRFGTTIMSLVSMVLEPITNRLLSWGNSLIGSAETIAKELKGPATKLAEFVEKYLIPQIEKIGSWFATTFKTLSSSVNVDDFWKKFKERMLDGWTNIKEVLGPPMRAMWDVVKPEVISAFKTLFEMMMDVVGDWVFEKTGLGELSKDRHAREDAMQTENFKRWAELTKKQGSWFDQGILKSGEQKDIYELYKTHLEQGKWKSSEQEARDSRTSRAQAAIADPRRVDSGRDFGTSGILGLNAEPKDATVNIEKGERVLSPKETTSYNNLEQTMNQLNNLTAQLLQAMRENNDLTRKTVDATKELNGNLFA